MSHMAHVAKAFGSTLLLLAGFAGTACAQTCDLPGGLAFHRPARGAVTAGFGIQKHPVLQVDRMHAGADFAVPLGEPVYAAAAGRVTKAARMGEFGNVVIIAHKDGLETRYAHLQRNTVTEGQCVTGGQVIGQAGTTGLSVSPHLHFEVYRDGDAIDPTPFIMPAR